MKNFAKHTAPALVGLLLSAACEPGQNAALGLRVPGEEDGGGVDTGGSSGVINPMPRGTSRGAGNPATGGTDTSAGGSTSQGGNPPWEPGGAGSTGAGGLPPDSAGGAPSSPPPPPATSTGTLTRRTTSSGRSFLVHIPSSIDPAAPAPLLFVHHGYNGSADQVRQLTRFDAIANEKGFVAVFPEGAGSTWNAGVGVCGFGQFVTGLSDDFGFEEEMIQAVSASVHVDRARVFVTGFSMGGYFSNNIGCMRPDLVRGIAPHSGGGPPPGCAASPMPALIVHGTGDSLIWYDCGTQAEKFWSGHNGCSSQVDVVPVKGGACEWHRGCPKGGQVVFCHMDGMPHGWAGVGGHDGGGTQYEDISRVIWDFFSRQ